jgi:hypothetical protein
MLLDLRVSKEVDRMARNEIPVSSRLGANRVSRRPRSVWGLGSCNELESSQGAYWISLRPHQRYVERSWPAAGRVTPKADAVSGKRPVTADAQEVSKDAHRPSRRTNLRRFSVIFGRVQVENGEYRRVGWCVIFLCLSVPCTISRLKFVLFVHMASKTSCPTGGFHYRESA